MVCCDKSDVDRVLTTPSGDYEQAYPQIPGGKPEAYFLNKTVRVTGRVRLHRNRPQIQVRDAEQIEVVQ